MMTKNTIKEILGKKQVLIFAVLAAVGILLMILAGNGDKKEEESVSIESMDPAKYALQVEERVEALCNRIDGVSSTYAVVTLKGGYRAIYASDLQSGGSSKNQTVIIGSGSGERGLLIGYENPEIAGIGIVCSGGDDHSVRQRIIGVVSSAFDLPSNKIFVAGG